MNRPPNQVAVRLAIVQQDLHRVMHGAGSWRHCEHPDCRFTRELLAEASMTPHVIERVNPWVTIER